MLELIENAPKLERPKSASCDEIVSNVKEIVERDTRYTIRDIAPIVGTSLSRVHYILKNIFNVKKLSARWVPHFLTGGQTNQRVKIAKQMLKIFPKFDEKKFANVVFGNET